jgi:hypothetical protein
MPTTHATDTDCTLGPDDCCVECGVHHGDACPTCGGRGFHAEGCGARRLTLPYPVLDASPASYTADWSVAAWHLAGTPECGVWLADTECGGWTLVHRRLVGDAYEDVEIASGLWTGEPCRECRGTLESHESECPCA